MPLSKFSNGLTKLVHREVLWAWEPVQCNCHLCTVGKNGGLTRTLHSSSNKRKILTLHLNELYSIQDWFKHNSNFPWFLFCNFKWYFLFRSFQWSETIAESWQEWCKQILFPAALVCALVIITSIKQIQPLVQPQNEKWTWIKNNPS